MVELSWKTPKTYMIHSWKMVVFVSLKHPFKIWLLRVPALLVLPFLGQVRCLNGKGKVPNKNDEGNKKPNENSQQNSQWKFPSEVEPFPAKIFWGETQPCVLGTHLRWDVPWIREIERLRCDDIWGVESLKHNNLFLPSRQRLWEGKGRLPKKRRCNWGEI